MALITLAELVAPAQPADILAQELSIGATLGLQTSSWQPLDPSRTIYQVNATIVASYADTVNFIAQGGYASYAALMTDATGTPITTWMDLIAFNNYNVLRFEATNAAGSVPVSNSNALNYPYTPNSPLKFQNPNPPNATYTSVGSGTIPAMGTLTISIVADAAYAGAAGNAGVGTTLIMLTPRAGVTVNPLTVGIAGTAQESNAALLLRCQNKLGALSALTAVQAGTTPVPAAPGGASGAYAYVAKSIPVGSPSSAWPYFVSAQITRVNVAPNLITGTVVVVIANSNGPVSSGDLAVVNAAIQALAVPQAVTASVVNATTNTVNVTGAVWIKSGSGLTPTQAQANILAALQAAFPAIPIGGFIINGGNTLPLADLEGIIFGANAGTVDVAFTSPTMDVPMLYTDVAVLGSTSFTINFV